MIQTCGLETSVTTATNDVSSTDWETLVARLTESKAINTDRRWEPTISMGDGHITTDADVDDVGEDLYNKVKVLMMGSDDPHVNLQPMKFPFILFNNNESCVTIEFC
jgi:hypothetical protein